MFAPCRRPTVMCSSLPKERLRASKNVAVIGAGAAGLVCCKELRDEGHKVTVYEQSANVGGTWVLDSATAPDENKTGFRSSMYNSLRTNLPREVMSFTSLPFIPEYMNGRSVDPRRYPGHAEVREYLEAYAEHFDLKRSILFNSNVTRMGPLESASPGSDSDNQWSIIANSDEALYDAVVVCNGHFSKPHTPYIVGAEEYPGSQSHSHNYRDPLLFADKVVVVFGTAASGTDLALEVANVAECVYFCGTHKSREKEAATVGPRRNIHLKPQISRLGPNGEVWFHGGEVLTRTDTILYCTGYDFSYPFMKHLNIVSTEGRRVSPLYKQLAVPYVSNLFFIGIPIKIIPFLVSEYQAKYIARLLSGRCNLPPPEEMLKEEQEMAQEIESGVFLSRHAHYLDVRQFDYLDILAEECGLDVEKCSSWRKQMYISSKEKYRSRLGNYRDCDPLFPELFDEAQRDFDRLKTTSLWRPIVEPVNINI